MSGKKIALVLISAALVLCALLISAGLLWSKRIERRAKAFLRDASSVEVGKPNFAETWKLLQEYDGKLGAGTERCTPKDCEAYFEFTNDYLYKLRLSTRARFFAEIHIKDGITQSRTTAFELGNGPGFKSADVLESFDDTRPFFIGPRTAGNKVVYLRVHINPSSTKEQRQKAYGFRLDCLTRIGGCKDAGELLPSIL
jgi:hypothetical protein